MRHQELRFGHGDFDVHLRYTRDTQQYVQGCWSVKKTGMEVIFMSCHISEDNKIDLIEEVVSGENNETGSKDDVSRGRCTAHGWEGGSRGPVTHVASVWIAFDLPFLV